jgi:beta-glucosidase/6-phospho-beta-glucosidase/beta-galactosidase
MVYVFNSLCTGLFPPGERNLLRPLPERVLPAVANIVAAHRLAHAILHEDAARRGTATRVGIAQNIALVEPWSDAPADVAAAGAWDRFFHWDLLDRAAEGGKLDFAGVNYYTRVYVKHVPGALPPLDASPCYPEARLDPVGDLLYRALGGRMDPGSPVDDAGREIYPPGIRAIARRAADRYKAPVLITENGLPDRREALRGSYILAHLAELKGALDDGVPVIGYLHWTLVDNYEWGTFAHKIGLFRCDFERGFKREIGKGGEVYRAFLGGR